MQRRREVASRYRTVIAPAGTGITFRRQGWDVYTAHGGPEVRRLARMLGPQLVVLQADLPDESGWLTCDKLLRELPHVRVILVNSGLSAEGCRFATFVGAAGLAFIQE